MNEIVRLALVFLGAAFVLSLGAAAALRGLRPDRRVRGALRRAAGAKPDAQINTGEGGVAFCSATGVLAVAWDKGRWRLTYPLEEVLGAEIIIDDLVAARAFAGETTRGLGRIPSHAARIALRLLFDEPGHPDFELVLWPGGAAPGEPAASPAGAARDANTWLARIDALVRRSANRAPTAVRPAAQVRVQLQDDFEPTAEELEED